MLRVLQFAAPLTPANTTKQDRNTAKQDRTTYVLEDALSERKRRPWFLPDTWMGSSGQPRKKSAAVPCQTPGARRENEDGRHTPRKQPENQAITAVWQHLVQRERGSIVVAT